MARSLVIVIFALHIPLVTAPWATACAPQETEPELPLMLHRMVDAETPTLLELYRHLHAHPELSLGELFTAARMAKELEGAGFTVTTDVGGTGVVGVLANGKGPVVLVRTDMDALPVTEATGLPFRSNVKALDGQGRETGVMHACGHDVHMTVWTGTARMLARLKERWAGTVVMIAQPAEELGAGALAMLEDGLYDRFPAPDYALALHVDPELEAGKVGYTSGPAFANVDSVDILVRGRGGHGARPHLARDPIVLAARIVEGLQTIASREVDPQKPVVVTIGSIHGGTKRNIIPSEVRLELTIRTYDNAVRDQVIAAIERIALNLGRAAGLRDDELPIVTHTPEGTPAVINDAELTERLANTFGVVLGIPWQHVEARPAEMWGEDFARYTRARPETKGCLFRLGSVSPDDLVAREEHGHPLPGLHSSTYAPLAAPTIATGVRAMTGAVLDLLAP